MTENTGDVEMLIEKDKEPEKSIQDKAYDRLLKTLYDRSDVKNMPTRLLDIFLSANYTLGFAEPESAVSKVTEYNFLLHTNFGSYAGNFSAYVSSEYQFNALVMLLESDKGAIDSSSASKDYIQDRFQYIEDALEFANQYQVKAMSILGVSSKKYALKIDNEYKMQSLEILAEKNIDQKKHQGLLDLIAEFLNSSQVDLLKVLLGSDLEQIQYQSIREVIAEFVNPHQPAAFKILGVSHIQEVLKFDNEFQVKLLKDTQLIYQYLKSADRTKLLEYIAYCLAIKSEEQYGAQSFNIVVQKFLTEYQFGGLEILGVTNFEYILKITNQYQVNVLRKILGNLNLESSIVYLDSVLDFKNAHQVSAFSILGVSLIGDALKFESELQVKALEKTKSTFKYLSSKAIAELPSYINSCLQIICEERSAALIATDSLEEAQVVACAGENPDHPEL